jgi:hypothetical protein
MEKRILTGAALIAWICILTTGTGMPVVMGQRSFSEVAPAGRILHAQPDFGKMPVNFIPNRGQLDERVAYYVQGKDKTIYFGAEGVTFVLTKAEASPWVVKLDFQGAKPGVNPKATDETGAVISYFQGEPGSWKTGLPTYSRIIYPNIWPGIDLVFSGTMDKLKYDFIVHPGADPARIRLAYRGASSVRINDRGSLIVSTPSGGFEDGVPVAYQERAGKRVNVPMAYKIVDSGDGKKDEPGLREYEKNTVTYGFSIGEYDQAEFLILDPVILVYCGYIGGPSYDYGYGIAADRLGNAYITGYTYSRGIAFPAMVGPDLTFNGGSMDAFVAKLNPSGTAFVYCGYIGGSGNDYGYGIAVDPSGNAYVTGYTSSKESTFPVSVGPKLIHRGLFDVFVAKVNANGTALDYCGYIGGSGNDYGRSIAVDGSGNAYITGYTSSNEASFPVSGDLDLSYNGGANDAFAAKVNADGTAFEYCGYIGGSGSDFGYGIAVDALGNAYITGYTSSTEASFPVSTGPDVSFEGGLYDAFVAKVYADGSALEYCGYIGGSGSDYGYGIAVDPLGNAYITGYTSSSDGTFPVSTGPDLTYNGGYYDAFVAKVDIGGGWLIYCGFIGGSGYDVGTGIAVDSRGYAFVTGYTSSKEDTFPVNVGADLTHNGSFDAFVAKADLSGAGLVYCTYIGGSDADMGMGIALDVDASGNTYLTGNTYSMQYTFPTAEGPDLSYNGNRDGFVAKIYENSITVTAPNGGETCHVGLDQDITWLTAGIVGNMRIEYSTDTGTTWIEITASTENDGIFTWTVPNTVSETCLVRITDTENGDLTDTSDAVFTITDIPVIIVTSPNGGESWVVGSLHNITWLSAGGVGDVKIEYTTDYGTTWIEIVASTENDGTYAWIVPDAVSDTCLVRISEAEDGDPVATSNSIFSITATTGPPAMTTGPPAVKRRGAGSGGPN